MAGSAAVADSGWEDYKPQAASDAGWEDYKPARPDFSASPLEVPKPDAIEKQELSNPASPNFRGGNRIPGSFEGSYSSGDTEYGKAMTGAGIATGVALLGGRAIPPVARIGTGFMKAHPLASTVGLSLLQQVPGTVGKIASKIPAWLPLLAGAKPEVAEEGEAAAAAKPTIAAPDVYRPGFRTPRAYYGGQAPEPIPPRRGLELGAAPPIEGEYVESPRVATPSGPPVAPAIPIRPKMLPESASASRDLPYRIGPGQIPPEDVNVPNSRVLGGKQGIITTPQRSRGLALPSGAPSERTDIAPKIPATKKAVGEAVDKSFGVQPLKPNVPLRQQIPASPKAIPASQSKAESSVIQSHRYDAASRELHVTTKSGTTYVYGDVDPEWQQKFDNAESKGKMWAEFKKNSGSPYVAKIENGTRTPIRPVIKAEDLNSGAGPRVKIPGASEDLSPDLQESVEMAKKRKIAKASE